ncbi:hypothetical protein JXO59_10405 [candidate division KSB1 bacterium]|nr:hypothetical protein [candidate division KSB1 bacterium]
MKLIQKTNMVAIVCLTWIVFPIAVAGQTGIHNQGSGTSEDPYAVPETDDQIMVDAVLEEPAWQDALTLELKFPTKSIRARCSF